MVHNPSNDSRENIEKTTNPRVTLSAERHDMVGHLATLPPCHLDDWRLVGYERVVGH